MYRYATFVQKKVKYSENGDGIGVSLMLYQRRNQRLGRELLYSSVDEYLF